MPAEPVRIAVCGMVAGVPGRGGASWAVLQWVLGLRDIGYDVLLLEPVAALRDDVVGYFAGVVARYELTGRAALIDPAGASWGMRRREIEHWLAGADLLCNLAGTLRDPRLLEQVGRRVYVDLDPAFTQLWQGEGIDMGFAAHTRFLTVGLNLDRPAPPVPDCGIRWETTLPPVALRWWPPAPPCPHAAWTTVAEWRGYGSPWRDGVRFGQKAHSWRAIIALPSLTDETVRPALALHPDERDDIALLRDHGWEWDDPGEVAATPWRYQQLILASKGEVCIAKEGYVAARSGWVSDRSVCYLASARPVVAQDTGVAGHLPCGEGFVTFRTAAEAAAAVDDVAAEYPVHSARAREIAADLMDARRVLSRIVESAA